MDKVLCVVDLSKWLHIEHLQLLQQLEFQGTHTPRYSDVNLVFVLLALLQLTVEVGRVLV